MPRQSRIDAPEALHHIICRGIERRRRPGQGKIHRTARRRVDSERGRGIAEDSGLNLEIAKNA